jgi:hypothetical protein
VGALWKTWEEVMKASVKRIRTTRQPTPEPRRPASDYGRVARRGSTLVVEDGRAGRRGSSGSSADVG